MATFPLARSMFEENTKIVSPQKDPLMWNLNNGLMHLCQSLQSELSDMERKLQSLEQTLRYIQNDVSHLKR